jgi:hypothetical protein
MRRTVFMLLFLAVTTFGADDIFEAFAARHEPLPGLTVAKAAAVHGQSGVEEQRSGNQSRFTTGDREHVSVEHTLWSRDREAVYSSTVYINFYQGNPTRENIENVISILITAYTPAAREDRTSLEKWLRVRLLNGRKEDQITLGGVRYSFAQMTARAPNLRATKPRVD